MLTVHFSVVVTSPPRKCASNSTEKISWDFWYETTFHNNRHVNFFLKTITLICTWRESNPGMIAYKKLALPLDHETGILQIPKLKTFRYQACMNISIVTLQTIVCHPLINKKCPAVGAYFHSSSQYFSIWYITAQQYSLLNQ